MAALLVNADDFGLHESVNAAISQCVDFGSVNSVSVIANGAAPDFELLKRFEQKGIFTGVHLTWVGEPWLTDATIFPDWKHLIRGVITGGKAFRTKLRDEAEAQIKRLLENGIHPDHIDSHQHVHHFPGLWQITVQLQQQYNIDRIRIVRIKDSSLRRKNFSGFVLNTLANTKSGSSKFFSAGIKHAGNYNLAMFEHEMDVCAGFNTELIVHPGLNNEALNKRYATWHFNWEEEFAALKSQRFLESLQQHNFILVRKE